MTTYNQPSSVTFKQNTKNITLNTAATVTTSGSLFDWTQNINTGSWQILTTGSSNPLRYGVFTNNSPLVSGSVIFLGIGSQVTSSTLWPDDTIIISHNNSVVIYAAASGSQSSVQLDYTLVGVY